MMRKIIVYYYKILGAVGDIILSIQKIDQVFTFYKLRREWDSTLGLINIQNFKNYVTPLWEDFNDRIKQGTSPRLPLYFLRKKVFEETMVVVKHGKLFHEEIREIENHFELGKLKKILREDPIGFPIIYNRKYMTSHNAVHTLYHLARFGVPSPGTSIIEWGGGYGKMCQTLFRATEGNISYAIIDSPLMIAIQWLYLSSTLGADKVAIATDKDYDLKRPITLIPLSFIDKTPHTCDMFLSTWALSESSEFAQQYVIDKDWFHAKRVLYAYQLPNIDLPKSDHAAQDLIKKGGSIQTIPFIPKSQYVFLNSPNSLK